MSDLHIDDFFQDAAKTLVLLYKQFPRKTMLYVEDVSGPDTPDEFGLHSPRHQACFDCFLWLADSGYFTFGELVRQEALDQAVLTHRGFLLLRSAFLEPAPPQENPDPLPAGVADERALTINRIRLELKHGTSFTLASTMRSILNQSRYFGEQWQGRP